MDTLNLTEKELKRKGQIMARIIESVREYFLAWNKPIKMNVLSAKYSRSLQHLGGFPETIEELIIDGAIEVSMRVTGGKDVYPNGACVRLDENSVLLKKN